VGKRTEYPHGTFSFADVMTTDVDGAKSFYSEFFGWSAQTTRAGTAEEYTLFSMDGAPVAGTFEQPPEQRDRGIPSNWVSYITVDDVDETSRFAREAGGIVVVEPKDVADAGRMAAILDTHCAGFCIWEPRKHGPQRPVPPNRREELSSPRRGRFDFDLRSPSPSRRPETDHLRVHGGTKLRVTRGAQPPR
jgi:predicted enzyme related to lactoylglutathione lyase